MAELIIRERQIGDVTILDLDGKISMGEGSIALRQAIRRLLDEGDKKKVVLDLEGTRYIDSSGIGELTSTYTSLTRSNVRVRLANLTQKSQDLLTITKLMTVYEVRDSVEEAVAELATEDVYISCPIYGCRRVIPFSDPWTHCRCMNCGSRISVEAVPSGPGIEVLITSLALTTYAQEHVRITAGMPTAITVTGRLDLFASEVLERAWLTIPSPRRVIFRVWRDISPAGMQKLLGFCASSEEDSAGVILARSNETSFFPSGSPVCTDERTAIAALGDLPQAAKWILDIRR